MPEFYAEKSIQIDASVKKVFSVISDFSQWGNWSPWLILEPETAVKIASDGKSYSWEGKIIGSGNMVSDKQEPYKKIDQTVNFIKPWKSSSPIVFLFKETPGKKIPDMKETDKPSAHSNSMGGTYVTWTMKGSLPFFMFWMKKSMSAFIGMDFLRGLLMLKDYVETGTVPSKLKASESNQYSGSNYIGIKRTCKMGELGSNMQEDIKRITNYIQQKKMQPSHRFFSIYHKFDMVNDQVTYTSGMSVDTVPQTIPADMISGNIPPMKTYDIIHTGAYRHLGNAWAMGNMHARAKKFKQDKKYDPFEVYENMPGEVPEDQLITRVCFPVKTT